MTFDERPQDMADGDTALSTELSAEFTLFLASTAHDMKNSLGVLSGTLEKLLDGGAGATDTPQLGHMLYQTRRLNDNLMHLLALYKQVGHSNYPFDLQPLAVGHLVEQVVSGVRTLLASKAITLEVDADAGLVWHFDEDLIIGVLGHAINNAVNYTKNRIGLRIALVDGQLELRVEDNGAGYPASMLAGLPAPRGINFQTNSTGLGLYFSSKVAHMHKHRGRRGSVRLENGGALGGGCFILTLP
jgi:two-component system sensor histidine kinase SenX3